MGELRAPPHLTGAGGLNSKGAIMKERIPSGDQFGPDFRHRELNEKDNSNMAHAITVISLCALFVISVAGVVLFGDVLLDMVRR